MTDWDLIGGVSLGCLTILFQWFSSKSLRQLRAVENAVEIPLENVRSTLEKEGSIAYACVHGTVGCTTEPLKSNHVENTIGVIQHTRLIEHRSKQHSGGFWSDEKRVLRDHVNSVPFHLAGLNGSQVHITDPLTANYLLDDLKLVYDHYDPTKEPFATRVIDRLFGAISNGLQETERMLPVGIPLLGIGQLKIDGSRVSLEPPADGSLGYILTTSSKGDVIRSMRYDIRIYRIIKFLLITGCSSCLAYYAWRKYKVFRRKKDLAEAEAALQKRRAATFTVQSSRASKDEDSLSCVVCMERPKEVILLDCGHVCVCLRCVQMLVDNKCPICRKNISRVLPAYLS